VAVLLTGGTGFVGRHVRVVLARRNVNVRLVSRTHPGSIHPNEVLTISEIGQISERELQDCEVLLHLAWGSLNDFKSEDHLVKVLPEQITFLGKVLGSGIKHIVVAGTCLEYGARSGKLTEGLLPEPTIPYGIAKNDLRSWMFEHLPIGVSLTWCRIFYPYGPGQSSSSLYTSVIRACELGTPLHMSHGKQKRDFLQVERLAEILVELSVAKRFNGIVNVGSGVPRSVDELVEEIVGSAGLPLKSIVRDLDTPENEPRDFWASTEVLSRLLEIDGSSIDNGKFLNDG
jgi:dTDP-6-deoxy-L-talose 4-dehydrogenase (NAD+)